MARFQIDVVRKGQLEFEAACSKVNAQSARFWYCKIRDWSPLARLSQLRNLVICDFRNADLTLLRELPHLQRLELHVVPQLTNMKVFRHLSELEVLDLEIPLMSAIMNGKGNGYFIDSLAPIASLSRLRSLSLSSIRVKKDGLRPLESIRSLREFLSDNVFTVEEFSRFAARRPDVRFCFSKPTWKLKHLLCKKCGAACVGLSGALRRRWACPKCDRVRVKAHVDNFVTLKTMYSS